MSAKDITAFLTEILVTSGVIWAATMALKTGMRKQLSPRAHLAVWIVPVVRLVLPGTFDTGVHLITMPSAQVWTASSGMGTDAARETEALPRARYTDAAPQPAVSAKQNYTGSVFGTPGQPVPQRNTSAVSFGADPAELAAAVWILAMLTGTALSLAGYERLRRDVKRRLVPGIDPLHKLFQECLMEAGIRKRVALSVQNELAQLEIRGAQVFTAQRALIKPSDRHSSYSPSEDTSLMQPGVYMEFQREINGIPCITQMVHNGMPVTADKQYSAPFMPERGTKLMYADWNVLMFTWESPAIPKEIVAPDSELIPLDEAKIRLVEALYRAQLLDDNERMQESGLEYTIDDMRLVMGYLDVKDDPDNALAVPAWFIRAAGTQISGSGGSTDVAYNIDEVMINALDGSTILMPGTAQNCHIG